ncbi:hypothetical protein GGR57DRAFT_463380 [Xylariaceae sp. FL1272]|nr:hypothetical protein GGR57DRAFT_463380 [Xylariaceae sp. FL1272]
MMPSFEREPPSDRHLRHQHSASSSNALVPMWDSSDPVRAPPPLPLNPQSPSVGTSRAGTSLAIQSAHAALNEKAREAALGPTLHKRNTTTDFSTERALVQRPSPHKRMQSLQPGTVRDLSLMIEGSHDSAHSTPRGSPVKEKYGPRPVTPGRRENEKESRSPEKDYLASGTPTPMSSSLTPVMRPAARRPPSSILGENTPPQSATMLALRDMSSPPAREGESPLANVTNHATAASTPMAVNDQLANQLMNLTNIATSLQKEMAQLSRRSRDNATDLMSLKEATHARDEDIRKSLRELATNVDTPRHHRDTYNGGLYLDNKAFNEPKTRQFALPRIPSPNSFVDSITASELSMPSLVGEETPATMALLEKIIREMGTRDGQDALVDRLSELAERLAGMASAAKVEELSNHVKKINHTRTIVPASKSQQRSLSFDSVDDVSVGELDWNQQNGAVAQRGRVEHLIQEHNGRHASVPARPKDVLSDDIINMIRSVKDCVAQGGGLTAEVKALVRELRGEVLGMGRELGRKLEESGGKSSHNKSDSGHRAELAQIVEESLEQMKVYMQQRLREHRRESTESTKSLIDYQEIYNLVRTAITESEEGKPQEPKLCRDDVMDAVKVAWEEYKPEIEIQQLGLERDEVLACIKEGLDEYAPRQEIPQGATRDEVFQAVVEGMKHYVPPKIDTPATLSRDEVLEAVRECLEEFEFPIAPSAMGNDLSREDMLHAVKEGLDSFEFNPSAALIPHDAAKETEIMDRLHDIMHFMRDEFKAVSEEAKQNVAANGRDTEQVLDATKDGFENLRAHMEEYVDRVSGNTGTGEQEELMANLVNSFDNFRDDLTEMIGKTSDNSRDLVTQEIESLREAVNSSLVPHVAPPIDYREALETIREGLDRVRSDLLRPHAGTTDILDALSEGFGDLRACIERVNDKPADLTANDEILEALKSGLDGVRVDIDSLRENQENHPVDNDRALAAVGSAPSMELIPPNLVRQDDIENLVRQDDIENLVRQADIENLVKHDDIESLAKHDDIQNLEVMLANLSLKLEAMESQTAPSATPTAPEGGLSKEDLSELEEMLRQAASKADLTEIGEMLQNGPSKEDLNQMADALASGASKEDINQMIEILQNGPSKEDLNQMADALASGASKEDVHQMIEMIQNGASKEDLQPMLELVQNAASKDDLEQLKALVVTMQESMQQVVVKEETEEETPVNLEDAATKEDILAIETIFRNTKARLDELIDGEQAVRKDQIDGVEAAVLETKESVTSIVTGLENVTRKEDLVAIESLVTQVTVALDEMKERAEKSLEDPEKVTKTDVDAIEAAVHNTKSLVEEISAASLGIAELPSKDDLIQLEGIMREIKEYNTAQAEANATALTQRQTEVLTVNERVEEVKSFLHEFQQMAKERLESGGNGIEALSQVLEDLSQTINLNATVGSDLNEMLESMKSEFEETRNSVVGAKLDTDDKFKETTDTLSEKFESKIGELVTKYEEFQLVMEDRTKAGEARDADMEAAVVSNKAVTEELKSLIDTLGSTVTDSLEKMEEASKTVFEKVEMLYSKAEDNHSDGLNEHNLTRDQVKQAITVVEGLQGQVTEYQPQILDAVKDVLLLVGQHYEHSKTSVTDIQQFIEDAKSPVNDEPLMLPPPPEKYDDTEVRAQLDNMDREVHSKLDKLVDHTHAAGKAYAQLDTLDKVHQQVVQTAADISEFLSSQKQRIENEYEDREKTLQETTIALERQRAEQENVSANLITLRDEEAQLRESIQALRTEQEFLTRQKTRLTADVSSLETALHIRKEELHAMDVRAEGLERRILEGVLDHSRALLMTKSSNKGREAMSRKRVARSSLGGPQSPELTTKQPAVAKSRALANVVSGNGSRASLIPPNPAGASRRILSLSQITNNVPTGGLKRSQSVRAPAATALRKGSWAPGRAGSKAYGDLDKENVEAVREADEEYLGEDAETPRQIEDAPTPVAEEEDIVTDVDPHHSDPEPAPEHGEEQFEEHEEEELDGDSETGTLRRSSGGSMGTTVITSAETESEAYSQYSGEGEEYDGQSQYDGSEWTESAVSGQSGASYEGDSFVSESIADTDSIAGEGEVVVYTA